MTDLILMKYASQIEFLQEAGDSGYDRFHSYRQTRVLAIGSGPFLVSLVAALFESGLSRFHVLITESDSVPTDRQRLANLTERARRTESDASVEVVPFQKEVSLFWREAVRPFHSILYVSQSGEMEELLALHAACRQEKKILIPALFARQSGLAGPLLHPDSEGCMESAWRRIHRTSLGPDTQQRPPLYSSTAAALLANVIVFEHFKTVTGWSGTELNKQIYWLKAQTCEGDWHTFIPHPLVTGCAIAERVEDLPVRLERDSGSLVTEQWFDYFKRLTSVQFGIFHTWEEGDLKQLPLSQCRVQAADPLADGPAELLPEIVIAAFTHEEARREAGLAGIEAHVLRMARRLVTSVSALLDPDDSRITQQIYIGVGAGQSIAEGVCRGLQKCLAEELGRLMSIQKPSVRQAQLAAVEDECCRFYIQALTTLHGTPEIGLGEDVCGFPVAWVGTGGHWYGCVGLNMVTALRQALVQALQQAQNEQARSGTLGLQASSVHRVELAPLRLEILDLDETPPAETLKSALQVLERNRKRLLVFQLILEPFLKEEPIEVFGVLLREEMPL